PLTGVGANNFETSYAEARRAFVARRPDSPLLNDREDLLAERAHNEYLQMLAEMGAPGALVFLLFCALLICAAWRALRHSRSPLALGATCSLVAFALGSGASSASFRWSASGLMFFFAAAVAFRLAARRDGGIITSPATVLQFSLVKPRSAIASLAAMSLVFLFAAGRQAAVAGLRQAAQTDADERRAEQLHRAALRLDGGDAETHFAYGMWLFTNRRHADAVPHLRYAVGHRFNSAGCYSFLASAEAGAGDARASAATMALAESIYPRSLYVRVRHAVALREARMEAEARDKFAEAAAADARKARGWWYLLTCGRSCASHAARADKEKIALAGELTPAPMIEAALLETGMRPLRFTLPPEPALSYAAPE
ncbi:MAG: hypothetical protein ACRD68_14725, partial [Pyrinomonadaceae bacterium]